MEPFALDVDLLLDRSGQRRGDQFILGPEVVHQPVDADTEIRGHRPQCRLGETLGREVDDHPVEKLTLELRIRGARHVGSP